MPFVPYHKFQNRSKLEGLVSSLRKAGSVSDDVYENFYRYHRAMIQKLRSANYNMGRLSEKLMSTDIEEAADITGDFMFEVNMSIDGFFYNSGSAMDILARIVLTLFGEHLPTRVYFEKAHTILTKSRPHDPILTKLSPPSWRLDFIDYRNALTHELILTPRYQIDVDITGPNPTYGIIVPLPDSPRSSPSCLTYRRHPNVFVYASTHFRRILRLANVVYGDIADRAMSNGSLPI